MQSKRKQSECVDWDEILAFYVQELKSGNYKNNGEHEKQQIFDKYKRSGKPTPHLGTFLKKVNSMKQFYTNILIQTLKEKKNKIFYPPPPPNATFYCPPPYYPTRFYPPQPPHVPFSPYASRPNNVPFPPQAPIGNIRPNAPYPLYGPNGNIQPIAPTNETNTNTNASNQPPEEVKRLELLNKLYSVNSTNNIYSKEPPIRPQGGADYSHLKYVDYGDLDPNYSHNIWPNYVMRPDDPPKQGEKPTFLKNIKQETPKAHNLILPFIQKQKDKLTSAGSQKGWNCRKVVHGAHVSLTKDSIKEYEKLNGYPIQIIDPEEDIARKQVLDICVQLNEYDKTTNKSSTGRTFVQNRIATHSTVSITMATDTLEGCEFLHALTNEHINACVHDLAEHSGTCRKDGSFGTMKTMGEHNNCSQKQTKSGKKVSLMVDNYVALGCNTGTKRDINNAIEKRKKALQNLCRKANHFYRKHMRKHWNQIKAMVHNINHPIHDILGGIQYGFTNEFFLSIDLANPSHLDPLDLCNGFTIWRGNADGWYFYMPNVIVHDAITNKIIYKGLAIKLVDGICISWNGAEIRHGTSKFTDKGPGCTYLIGLNFSVLHRIPEDNKKEEKVAPATKSSKKRKKY